MRELLVVVVVETCDCSAAVCLLLCCFGPPDDAFLLRLLSPLEKGVIWRLEGAAEGIMCNLSEAWLVQQERDGRCGHLC